MKKERTADVQAILTEEKVNASVQNKKTKDNGAKLIFDDPILCAQLIGKIMAVLLSHINLPREEVEQFTDRIERREFDMLFDSFEGYDIQ